MEEADGSRYICDSDHLGHECRTRVVEVHVTSGWGPVHLSFPLPLLFQHLWKPVKYAFTYNFLVINVQSSSCISSKTATLGVAIHLSYRGYYEN